MAVLVQEQVDVAYSFIIHTHDPISGEDLVSIEIAKGLGETLASGN